MNQEPTSDSPLVNKTREQIALELYMSISTFRRRLKKKDIVLPHGLVSPKWQKIIYEAFWYPPGVRKKDYEDL